jgi:hypothetical protein
LEKKEDVSKPWLLGGSAWSAFDRRGPTRRKITHAAIDDDVGGRAGGVESDGVGVLRALSAFKPLSLSLISSNGGRRRKEQEEVELLLLLLLLPSALDHQGCVVSHAQTLGIDDVTMTTGMFLTSHYSIDAGVAAPITTHPPTRTHTHIHPLP